ncbi:MAG TPA: hypothetical protein P5277_04570 [Candidatus Paceibacterota bacterium]|nr:hypothetical protein [Candidatus Paceibacterota bacterium]
MESQKIIEEINKEEKRIKEGNVSLIINSYNELFSDFDPRPSNERTLSDDFLIECRRAARDKEIGFELRILIPEQKRDSNEELLIKKRLKSHFQKKYHEKINEVKKTKREGIMWFLIGAILGVIATFIGIQENNLFIVKFIVVMLEPASWFTMWSGLDKIFLDSRKEKPDITFYKKMIHADIKFTEY